VQCNLIREQMSTFRGSTVMKRLDAGDAVIAYADEGDGDVVLLLHGSFTADWFVPVGRRLVDEGYRVLRMHRAGYGQSKDLTEGVSVAAHADHVVRVLEDAGVQSAHVVGHSSGASVALQLAHADPDLVRSLVLLEPAFPYAPDEPSNPAMPRAIEAARAGDYEQAFELFLAGVSGSGFREVFIRELGEEGLREAVASSQYFFLAEAAALAGWKFGAREAAGITAPTLLVVGGEGERLNTPHRARSAQLSAWMPHPETQMLPGVSHSMPLEDPALVTETIRGFITEQW
jgi:pimeloyl-ACP methyl ester carboxylesterase